MLHPHHSAAIALGLGMRADEAAVVEEALQVEGIELGFRIDVITVGEEDLYRDTTPQLQDDDPLPDWIIDLKRYEIIRPVLELHDWPLKMAA